MTIELLDAAGAPYEIVRHPSLISAADLVRELGFPRERMVKTLAFHTGADRLLLVALPETHRVAYGQVARLAGVPRSRLRAADADDVRALGMEPGGITPITADATVALDPSVCASPVTYCGTGRAGETLKISTEVLVDLVRPTIVDLSQS